MGALLVVRDAGHGTTPPCPEALYRVGQVLRARRRRYLGQRDDWRCAVAAVVPTGFPAEYALADAQGVPRPLMVTQTRRYIRYVVGFDNDRRPYIVRESDLLPTDEADVTVRYEE